MPKMHYFSNKFSKIAKRWGLSVPRALFIFNIGDLKLYTWFGQLLFSKLIMAKLNFKKSVMTSFQWCRRHYVTVKCH